MLARGVPAKRIAVATFNRDAEAHIRLADARATKRIRTTAAAISCLETVCGGRRWTRTSGLMHVKRFGPSAVLRAWSAKARSAQSCGPQKACAVRARIAERSTIRGREVKG